MNTQINTPTPPVSTPVPAPTPPKPKRARKVIGWNTLGCALYVMIPLLALLLAALFFVAETGVIRVPIFSRWYEGPKPVRTVEAAPISGDTFLDEIGNQVGAAIQKGERPPYRIHITEELLTAALRGGLEELMRGRPFIADRPQAVLTERGMELFVAFRSRTWKADVRIRFSPDIHDEGLHFHVEEAYLGDIPIAPSLVGAIEGAIFKRNLRAFTIGVGENRLNEVTLYDGSLDLVLTPKAGE